MIRGCPDGRENCPRTCGEIQIAGRTRRQQPHHGLRDFFRCSAARQGKRGMHAAFLVDGCDVHDGSRYSTVYHGMSGALGHKIRGSEIERMGVVNVFSETINVPGFAVVLANAKSDATVDSMRPDAPAIIHLL